MVQILLVLFFPLSRKLLTINSTAVAIDFCQYSFHSSLRAFPNLCSFVLTSSIKECSMDYLSFT